MGIYLRMSKSQVQVHQEREEGEQPKRLRLVSENSNMICELY
jgi:hypothetical protein